MSSIAVPVLVIALATPVVFGLGSLWPNAAWHQGHTLGLVLCVVTFPIGIWVRRTATSKRQRLSALIGPIAFLGGWTLLLHGIDEKIGGLVQPLDYIDGLGPIVGIALGYVYPVLAKRVRPSNNRWRGP